MVSELHRPVRPELVHIKWRADGKGARSGFWSVHRRLRSGSGPELGASARQRGQGSAQLVLPNPDLSIDDWERRRDRRRFARAAAEGFGAFILGRNMFG